MIRMCFSTRCPFSAFSVLGSRSPMTRSESRTDDTSGLVTITAVSAYRIASVAPRSMPAGLSQITQSNLLRNSSMAPATPCSVSASFVPGLRGRQRPQRLEPLVSDEGLRKLRDALDDVDRRLRDAPLSSADQGLRRPTSKSTTAIFCLPSLPCPCSKS